MIEQHFEFQAAPKLRTITALGNRLYALDESGSVWTLEDDDWGPSPTYRACWVRFDAPAKVAVR